MDIWHKMIVPLWLTLSSPLKPRKRGAGLLKLQDDVQTCGYEDIQVMWEMLRRTESEHHKRKKQPFWRILAWSSPNHT